VTENQAPTAREMDILKVLWDIGPASVRDVYRQLAKHEDLAYNTVQTFMRIMEDKGLIEHHVEGRAFIYTPIHTREESVHGFLDQVFDGAADQLVMALLRSEKLSSKELDKLQKMIEAARK
jgi:BlaI family penicillinase repressor